MLEFRPQGWGHIMHRTWICGLAALAVASISGSASACGSGRLSFSDAFKSFDSNVWGDSTRWVSVSGGKLTLSQMDGNFYAVTAARKFRDVDFCTVATLMSGSDLAAAYGGLTFWQRGPKDFYTFQITLDGYADVYRYNGDWTAIIDDRPFDSIKQGVGAVNELRVVTHASTATFYVNGVEFDSITEKRPPGTSRIGLMVDSPPQGGSATFAFSGVEVREPN